MVEDIGSGAIVDDVLARIVAEQEWLEAEGAFAEDAVEDVR